MWFTCRQSQVESDVIAVDVAMKASEVKTLKSLGFGEDQAKVDSSHPLILTFESHPAR